MTFIQLSTLEQGGRFFKLCFYPICHWSSERLFLHSSTTMRQHCQIHSQVAVVAPGGRSCFVQPVFSTAAWSTGHQIRFQITHDPFAPHILETDSPPVHLRDASCPGSKPHPVMTGWQCWQGSAEPTTPPSLWEQSLHRNKDIRGDKEWKHYPCSIIH